MPDTKTATIESFLSGTNGTFQFVNGVCGGETGAASYSVSGKVIIGAQSPASSFYDGDIAEVLIYTNTLSLQDHSVVVKYLLQKYLPGPHVTFLGDSLTFGENAANTSSYPYQVMNLIPPQKRFLGVSAENLGNQGESFCNPANQFFSRLQFGNRSGNEIVVFWYGANDLLLYDTNTIFTHFFNACQFLRNQGVKVVLVDNIPRGPSGGGGTNTWTSAQNLAAMERNAGTNMYDAFVDLTADPVLGTTNIWTNSFLMNTNDQTHLTARGYAYVATNVCKAIMPLVEGFVINQPVLFPATNHSKGDFQFWFQNFQGAAFTVIGTTNPLLPMNQWDQIGFPVNQGVGQYQFSTSASSNMNQIKYFSVRCP